MSHSLLGAEAKAESEGARDLRAGLHGALAGKLASRAGPSPQAPQGTEGPPCSAAGAWAEALRAWAVPEDILASAPEPPWGFPVELFLDGARRALEGPPTPTHRVVAEALPEGGALLDVGCGCGAASLPVAHRAGRLVAVDQDEAMLSALADLAASVLSGAELQLIAGRWPDIAPAAGPADVAVAANVAYNVADLGDFVAALTAACRRRAVLELTACHPLSWLNPLWEHFWGLQRPEGPSAEEAAEVVREATGKGPHLERWVPSSWPLSPDAGHDVGWVRRRLCLPEGREGELAQALARLPRSAPQMVTMWWPGG